MEKICNFCQLTKPLEDFALQANGKYGRNSRCKACKNEYAKAFRLQNLEAMRHKERLKWRYWRYNITIDQYNEMCKRQDYRCALCNRERQLVVDHDHLTSRIRGLLCKSCNAALGVLGDSIESLQRVLKYLEGQPSGVVTPLLTEQGDE